MRNEEEVVFFVMCAPLSALLVLFFCLSCLASCYFLLVCLPFLTHFHKKCCLGGNNTPLPTTLISKVGEAIHPFHPSIPFHSIA